MRHEEIGNLLSDNGWKEYPDHIRKGTIWAKHFPCKFECQCNNRGGVQIVIEVYHPCEYRSEHNYAVDLTAEKKDGVWCKLQCYGLRGEIGEKLDFQVKQLIAAWESMNQ